MPFAITYCKRETGSVQPIPLEEDQVAIILLGQQFTGESSMFAIMKDYHTSISRSFTGMISKANQSNGTVTSLVYQSLSKHPVLHPSMQSYPFDSP